MIDDRAGGLENRLRVDVALRSGGWHSGRGAG